MIVARRESKEVVTNGANQSPCTKTDLIRETLFAAVDAAHLDWSSEAVRDELDTIFSLSSDQWERRLALLGLNYEQIRERAERRRAPTKS